MQEGDAFVVTAINHGNWSLENAKAKLHNFKSENKINAAYIVSSNAQNRYIHFYNHILFLFPFFYLIS